MRMKNSDIPQSALLVCTGAAIIFFLGMASSVVNPLASASDSSYQTQPHTVNRATKAQ